MKKLNKDFHRLRSQNDSVDNLKWLYWGLFWIAEIFNSNVIEIVILISFLLKRYAGYVLHSNTKLRVYLMNLPQFGKRRLSFATGTKLAKLEVIFQRHFKRGVFAWWRFKRRYFKRPFCDANIESLDAVQLSVVAAWHLSTTLPERNSFKMATQSIIYFFGGWVCSTNQRHIKQNLDFFPQYWDLKSVDFLS